MMLVTSSLSWLHLQSYYDITARALRGPNARTNFLLSNSAVSSGDATSNAAAITTKCRRTWSRSRSRTRVMRQMKD
ncbi:uncharacterized protein G2W53_041339 [Senna tora]|uniref:Uncharacterized protein n=1 Tax=Senna tora TaxID=362788 RepID=A0A834SH85_9FABA|nr:uncharacterized protein G2W53_041339 [Senna tora]